MRDIIRKTPIERLCVSVSISPLEMALALAGLNPNMRIGDVPSEHFEYVDMVRKALAKALRIYRNEKTATDEACHALDVLLAAFLFTDPSTPEIIIQKIEEAIDDLRGTKGWEDKARKLGGLALIRHIKDTNKSGMPCLPPTRAAAAVSMRSTSASSRESGLLSGWLSFWRTASMSHAVLSAPESCTAALKSSTRSAGTRKVTEMDLLIMTTSGRKGLSGYFTTVRQRKTTLKQSGIWNALEESETRIYANPHAARHWAKRVTTCVLNLI